MKSIFYWSLLKVICFLFSFLIVQSTTTTFTNLIGLPNLSYLFQGCNTTYCTKQSSGRPSPKCTPAHYHSSWSWSDGCTSSTYHVSLDGCTPSSRTLIMDTNHYQHSKRPRTIAVICLLSVESQALPHAKRGRDLQTPTDGIPDINSTDYVQNFLPFRYIRIFSSLLATIGNIFYSLPPLF